MSNVRVIRAKALVLVKHAQEDVQDGVAVVIRAGLAVDVEQHHVGRFTDSLGDVCPDRAVYQLLLIKKVGGPLGITVGIKRFLIFQQVGERFQKVRFTRPKEATHPNAHAVGDRGVIQRGGVGFKKGTKVLV